MSVQRFLGLWDIHAGWERKLMGGRWKTCPTYHAKALTAVRRFADDFIPDVLILGGDQLNCGPVSHWNKGYPILQESFRLKEEYELLDETVLEYFQPVHRKIWHDGNHEVWIQKFVEANPGVMGLLEPAAYLNLKERGWELYSQGEISRLGKVHFIHGDVIFGNGGGVNPAKKLVTAYRRNIRAGHIHTYSAETEVLAVDSSDYHTGVVVPALSSRAPHYAKSAPNNHLQGFLYGYVHKDGSFNDSVAIINNGIVTINGKRYDGSKA